MFFKNRFVTSRNINLATFLLVHHKTRSPLHVVEETHLPVAVSLLRYIASLHRYGWGVCWESRNGLTLTDRNTGKGWIAPKSNYVVMLAIVEGRDLYHSLRTEEPGACYKSLLRSFVGRGAQKLGAAGRWWKTSIQYHGRLAVIGRFPLRKDKSLCQAI